MYVDEHPLALALDIDTVRGMLGCWLDHSSEAGLIARRLAVAMAQVLDRPIIVDKFLHLIAVKTPAPVVVAATNALSIVWRVVHPGKLPYRKLSRCPG